MKTLKNLFSRKTKGITPVTLSSNSGDKSTFQSEVLYQCPMKCEDDKTYNAPGNCPACNMKLVVVDTRKGSHSHSYRCC